MNLPKVLAGCPTYEGSAYCLDPFIKRIKGLSYKNYDILIIDNSEGDKYYNQIKEKGVQVIKEKRFETPLDTLIHSRNSIIDYALKNSYDYLLMLDQDVIPPLNIIEELMQFDKDIISGIYFNYFTTNQKVKYLPVAWKWITPEEFEKMQKIAQFPPSVKSHKDIRRHLTL